MTKIKDATTNLLGAAATGNELIAIGTTAGSTSVKMTLSELKAYIGTALDKIEEADSRVEVVDSGTGYVQFVLDGTEIFRVETSSITPLTTNTLDIGTVAKKIKDIHMSGGIELGSDAQGDIYYRDGSGNLARLAPGTANYVLTTNGAGANPTWSAASGSGDSRWQTWTASRTDDETITSTTHLALGTPVRFRATAGTYEYAIVTARSTDAHTIVGNICSISLDDEFEYGVPELVHTETFIVPGAFADGAITAGATAGLLYDDLLMKLHYIWNKSDAHLVQLSTVCTTGDSSTDPNITVRISADNVTYNSVYSSNTVNTTLNTNSAENVATTYDIGFGYYLDFSMTSPGAGDAKDITIFLTFILE